jgi:hypothetical protein
MESSEEPPQEIVWTKPREMKQASRQMLLRENFVIFRAAVVTAGIACPIAALIIKWLHLPVPVWPIFAIVFGWIGVVALLALPRLMWSRWRPVPVEPRADLYRLTGEGLSLPQYRPRDPAFVKWDQVKWWRVGKARRLSTFRTIVICIRRAPLRRAWLPNTDADGLILAAFEKHVGKAR